jgi:predicted GNAT superfamily acetyltransferase
MIEIRALHRHEEFVDAVRLQQRSGASKKSSCCPCAYSSVASKVGGQAFGAYDNGRMVDFAWPFPASNPGNHRYLHSHMLGVLKEYRDAPAWAAC